MDTMDTTAKKILVMGGGTAGWLTALYLTKTFPHYHKVTNELNYIVKGELMVNGKHLKEGDMWIYEPNEVSDVENLTDNELIVVRWPSIPSDKYKAKII